MSTSTGRRSVPGRAARYLCPVAAAGLVGYALIYLLRTLPTSYQAAHWRLAWVGLDLGMAALLLVTWWLLARRSALVTITATATGTLLLADAWFDVVTAQPADLGLSLASLSTELSMAGLLFWLAVRELVRQPARGRTTADVEK